VPADLSAVGVVAASEAADLTAADHLADTAPVIRRVSRLRRWLTVAALLPLAAIVVASGFLPWEWSFIDDGGLIARLRADRAGAGQLHGVWNFIEQSWRFDLSWGLFRPLFWVFSSLFYLLPAGAAHAVRVAMLLVVVVGAMVVAGRRFTGRDSFAMGLWAGAAVAVDASLYTGLYYPSLQELSGLCLVALGLLARRRPVLRLLAFLGAAWFKAPFAWLLVAYGLLLLRHRRTRRLGAAYTALGVGTLAVLAAVARTGVYAQSSLSFTGHTVLTNVNTAVSVAGWVSLLLIVGVVLLRPRFDLELRPAATDSADGATAPGDPIALALLFGGLGYLVNLLFWHTGGYYASGYLYLLTVGVLLGVRSVGPLRPLRLLAALLVPVLLAMPVLRAAGQDVWRHNEAVAGLSNCLLSLPGAPTVGYNRHEAWERLDFIVREHRPDWGGRVLLVEDGATASTRVTPAVTRFDYYIRDTGYGPGTPALMTGPIVCTAPNEVVYQVLN